MNIWLIMGRNFVGQQNCSRFSKVLSYSKRQTNLSTKLTCSNLCCSRHFSSINLRTNVSGVALKAHWFSGRDIFVCFGLQNFAYNLKQRDSSVHHFCKWLHLKFWSSLSYFPAAVNGNSIVSIDVYTNFEHFIHKWCILYACAHATFSLHFLQL